MATSTGWDASNACGTERVVTVVRCCLQTVVDWWVRACATLSFVLPRVFSAPSRCSLGVQGGHLPDPS